MKRCPFCKCANTRTVVEAPPDDPPVAWVECRECTARGPMVEWGDLFKPLPLSAFTDFVEGRRPAFGDEPPPQPKETHADRLNKLRAAAQAKWEAIA